MDIQEKLTQLETLLTSYGRVAIGFSGGVDSTFLAAVCTRVLPNNTVLIHLDSPLVGTPEQTSSEREAQRLGLPLIRLTIDPLANKQVVSNPHDRCFHCKHAGFSRILAAAQEAGCNVVLDGSNADDAHDYRPGMKAVEELGVYSPLMETGWTKEEERGLLRTWGYEVWDLPSGACLATRVPCGEVLTEQKLTTIRTAEDYLSAQGCRSIRARLKQGVIYLEGSPSDLVRICEPGGDSMTSRYGLQEAIRQELVRICACDVAPYATRYQRGAMNA